MLLNPAIKRSGKFPNAYAIGQNTANQQLLQWESVAAPLLRLMSNSCLSDYEMIKATRQFRFLLQWILQIHNSMKTAVHLLPNVWRNSPLQTSISLTMDQYSDRRSSSSGQNIPICFTKWTVLFLIHLSLLINLVVNEEDVKTQMVMVQSEVIWLTKAHNGELFWRWWQTFNFSSLPSRRTGIYTSVFVNCILGAWCIPFMCETLIFATAISAHFFVLAVLGVDASSLFWLLTNFSGWLVVPQVQEGWDGQADRKRRLTTISCNFILSLTSRSSTELLPSGIPTEALQAFLC